MLRNILCLAMIAIVCSGCCAKKCGVAAKDECPKMLKHVVLFKFKEGTTPGQIKEVEKAFAALPGKIDIIKGFEAGTNVSTENHSEGFTHCFVVSFSSAADRDAYLIHPAHKEFGKSIGGCVDKVLVVDYWNK